MGKRKKSYYIIRSNKRSRDSEVLRPGIQGYVVTCNNDRTRRDTVMEAYRILNEYADIKYGPEIPPNEEEDDDKEVNIEDALKKEVSDIKNANAKGAPRRFQSVSTKVKNIVFIKSNVPNPTNLLHDIYSDLMSSQIKKTKYCLRFLPVVCTCYANTEKIIKFTKQCVEPVFVNQSHIEVIRFCIVWKMRCNTTVSRDDVLPPILDYIYSKVEHVTDYINPEVVVNIDIIGNICCIGFLRDYAKFRKYNLDLIVQTTEGVTEKQKVLTTEDKKTSIGDKISECENKIYEKMKVEIAEDNAEPSNENIKECDGGHQDSGIDGKPVKEEECDSGHKDSGIDGKPVEEEECNSGHQDSGIDGKPVKEEECDSGHQDSGIDGKPVKEDNVAEKQREIEEIKV